MTDSDHRAASHQRTLGILFEHPIARNAEWRDVVHLLESLGTVVDGAKGTVHVTVNGQSTVFHRPKHKDVTDGDQLMQIRHFLLRAGVEPPHPEKGPTAGP